MPRCCAPRNDGGGGCFRGELRILPGILLLQGSVEFLRLPLVADHGGDHGEPVDESYAEGHAQHALHGEGDPAETGTEEHHDHAQNQKMDDNSQNKAGFAAIFRGKKQRGSGGSAAAGK